MGWQYLGAPGYLASEWGLVAREPTQSLEQCNFAVVGKRGPKGELTASGQHYKLSHQHRAGTVVALPTVLAPCSHYVWLVPSTMFRMHEKM